MSGIVKLSTLSLAVVLALPRRLTGAFVRANRAALISALSASMTYLVVRAFQRARHYQLKLQPLEAKSPLKYLIGHVPEVGETGTWACYLKWTSKSVNNAKEDKGMPALIDLFGVPRILCNHALDIDYVVGNEDRFKKGRGYELISRFVGSGLLTLFDDKIHSAHRRILGPAFSPKSLKHLANTVVPEHTMRWVEKIGAECDKVRGGAPFLQDLQPWLDNLTFGIIAQVAFKSVKSEEETNRIRELFTSGMDASFSIARMSPIVEALQFGNNKIAADCRRKMMELVSGITKQVRTEGSESVTEERADALIDYLVHSKAFTEQEISDHSIVFLFAGFDTTSSAMGWAFYLLAKHPEIQEKLFEEVSHAIGLGQSTTMDSLRDCKYLAAVCKETLRVFPPAHMVARNAKRDGVLPGSKVFVAKGTNIMCSLTSLHRNKKYWGEDADDFKPERWEEPGFDEKVNGFCFMPFIVGKRNCIGKDFAMNEFLLVISMVARNFHLGFPKGAPDAEPAAILIARPKVPIQLEISKREK